MKKLSAFAVLLVVAALAVAACGGGSSSTSGGTEAAAGGSETTEAETGTSGGAAAESSGSESESSAAGSTIKFEANPEGQLMFTTMKTTGKAGNDTIDFKNPSTVPHNVAIEDEAGETIAETETIGKGETSTEAELEPGTYTYYCTVPGHREAGMEGTLTVE